MSKTRIRIVLSGDWEQSLHEFRNPLAHGDTSNVDLLAKSKDGKTLIFASKHHGNSAGHILPRTVFLRGAGMSSIVAKPDDLIMPEIALKLVPFIVPRKLRDGVMGDLTEDFRTYAARWGRPYALYLLCWELAELCIRRFGPTAIVMGIGAWFRQKLGL